MTYVWVQCRTEDDAQRLKIFALIGAFNGGESMPARISPVCARTVDVNFGSHPVDMTRITALNYVVMADYFAGPAWMPDPQQELHAELTRLLAPQPHDNQLP